MRKYYSIETNARPAPTGFVTAVANTIIDIFLLAACVFVVSHQAASEKSSSPVWSQNYSPITWDARELIVPGPIAAISVGTLPVSLTATLAFPNWLQSSPFDLRWVGLHVLLGIVFWWAAGRIAEPFRSWRMGLVGYVALRIISIPASLTFFRNGWADLRDLWS